MRRRIASGRRGGGIALAVLSAAVAGVARGQSRADSFDVSTTYQTIDSFAANDAWTAQDVGGWTNTTAKNAIADLLFSTTSGIGLSGWRYNLGAGIDPSIGPDTQRTSDTYETAQNTYDWTKCPNQRWFLAAAKARGVSQFGMIVYSPTLRMTKNGHSYCDSTVGTTNLQSADVTQYAKYLTDVLKHFATNTDTTQQINFSYVSPVNEPEWQWNTNSQEGNRASASDIKSWVTALSTQEKAQNVTTQIAICEAGEIQDMYGGQNYISNFAGDATVNTLLGKTLSYHSYFSDDPSTQLIQTRQSFAAKMANYSGWKAWETEYAILGSNGPGRDLTMTTALNVARVIHYDLSVADVTSWSWWLAFSDHNYKDSLIYTDDSTQTYQTSKTLWALGNYSRFIRPGDKRISFSGDNSNVNGLLASAYRDDPTSTINIVYVNEQSSGQAVTVSINNATGFKTDYVTPYVTSDTAGDDLKAYSSVLVGTSYTVPALSVVTLHSGTLNENNDGKTLIGLSGSRNYTLGSGTLAIDPGDGTYSGVLSGAGGFIKSGSGTTYLTGSNTFTGNVTIGAGVLKMGNAAALGSTAGSTTIATGGTLDLNGLSPAMESITASGTGSSGQGAIISTGTNNFTQGLASLTLTADTTIGGSGRWDLRSSVTPVLNANGHSLTKTGTNEIWLTDATISGLEDITINQGKLGFDDNAGGMGDASRTITVNSGATLGFFNDGVTPIYQKNLTVNSGTIGSYSGNTTFSGNMTFNGAVTFDVRGSTLVLLGTMHGSGSITKIGSGTLQISPAMTYAGTISAQVGKIVFGGSANVAAVSVADGARVELSAGGNKLLSLSALTVSGSGTLDLQDNDLVLPYSAQSPASSIRAMLVSGYNNSNWNGIGITSTTAANDSNYSTALGYAEASDLAIDNGGSFDGQTISNEAVIVKYTYYGDSNLDGTVTTDDFFAFVAGFNGQGSGWTYGDYNYDGQITTDDLFVFVAGFNSSGQPLSQLQDLILNDSDLSISEKSTMLASVPEPTGMAVFALGAMTLMRRRRAVRG